jgi:hypothetical protein
MSPSVSAIQESTLDRQSIKHYGQEPDIVRPTVYVYVTDDVSQARQHLCLVKPPSLG